MSRVHNCMVALVATATIGSAEARGPHGAHGPRGPRGIRREVARGHTAFRGWHPLPERGGFCYLDGTHGHGFAARPAALYQPVGGAAVFVGDPTPFGYEGQRFTFYGHHPLTAEGAAPLWCDLDGPHYHFVEPPRSANFRVVDGVAYYVGAPDARRAATEREHAAGLSAIYAPYAALRPRVVAPPPPEWHGARGPSPVAAMVVPPPPPAVPTPPPARVPVARAVPPASPPGPHGEHFMPREDNDR